jgi:DNA-binding CsgD family transcriptional regulator
MLRAIPQRSQLSPREQEIVRRVAQGHPNQIIADCLGISLWTAGTYRRRIFATTGVGLRAAMVARVLDKKPGADARRRIPTGKKGRDAAGTGTTGSSGESARLPETNL